MTRLRIFILSLLAVALAPLVTRGQELNCSVEINSSKIEGTDKSPFEELQEAITEYVNTRKWTNTQFAVNEKIECRLFFTISKYEDEKFTGDLQVQLSRPVYNSTYTTPLLNFKDTKIEFTHRRGESLDYNDSMWENNLTGIINYYVYLFLALDFDSFSPLGGQPYFDKVATIVQMAQSSGETGWRAFEDTKNRSAVLSSYTDAATSGIRDLMYTYHRKGLDEMVTSPDKGRAAITESLQQIKKIHASSPMSVALSIFKDTKLDELVNVYSGAPESERTDVYNLLKDIYPTETERLDKIRDPEQNR